MSRTKSVAVLAWVVGCAAGCAPAAASPSDAGTGIDAFAVPDAVWFFPDAPFFLSDGSLDGPPPFTFDAEPPPTFDALPPLGDTSSSCSFFGCDTDERCLLGCVPPAGRTVCCDRATRACYIASVCPSPFLDGGLDAAADAACPASPIGVDVSVDAPGLAGVTVELGDNLRGISAAATLDGSGHGMLTLSQMRIAIDASGRSRLADPATLEPVTMIVQSADGSASIGLTITTQMHDVHEGWVSAVALAIRRDPTTGACVASVVSATEDCAVHPGLYDPSRFDDEPCGPFR